MEIKFFPLLGCIEIEANLALDYIHSEVKNVRLGLLAASVSQNQLSPEASQVDQNVEMKIWPPF